MRRFLPLIVLLGLLGALAPTATPARAEVVERVVAVVNDEAIFLSELRRRAAPFLSRIAAIPTDTERMAAIQTLYTELLERMVQEELFIQAADELDVTVTRAEVDRAIANVQRQSQLQDAEFWEAVRGQGFTPEQYRADVRRQLLRLKVLNQRARGRVNITEAQVRARYDEQVARGRRTSRFNANNIFIELSDTANATQVAAAQRQAAEIRARIHNAEDFAREMAAIGGGELGWLSQGELPEVLEDELMNLDPGEVGQPVRSDAGIFIFLLLEREQGATNAPAYADVRMDIYGEMMETAMREQETIYLAELRRQAVIDLRL
jgi:peptidyl-prolyl cis-trans isomerase SurA